MRWMTSSTSSLLMLALLALASACWRGTSEPRALPPAPTVPVREPCLRAPPPQPTPEEIEMLSSAQGTELEALLWRRLELAEIYNAKAWAACGGSPR